MKYIRFLIVLILTALSSVRMNKLEKHQRHQRHHSKKDDWEDKKDDWEYVDEQHDKNCREWEHDKKLAREALLKACTSLENIDNINVFTLCHIRPSIENFPLQCSGSLNMSFLGFRVYRSPTKLNLSVLEQSKKCNTLAMYLGRSIHKACMSPRTYIRRPSINNTRRRFH